MDTNSIIFCAVIIYYYSINNDHLHIKQNIILPMLQISIDSFSITADDRKWLALPPKGVLPLIKKKCNMHEKLDEVTTAPPRLLSHRGRSFLRPQRVEQRKLSPRNFYVDERKKCKSSPDALTLRCRRPGKDKKTKEFKMSQSCQNFSCA